ncbi:hypothetical protein FHX74_002688 [Friedmanniella endophytica]|uniref:Uncharacterized protein n=1 Tax=Microlunatus kandeliicorticis TaxID=1759536 RepID=A0A7W3P6M1_9ACTN|nr:hypothetical protein [Microlunatus kandeliicorticis]MBA8795060.1 hypothetical protein [Microlunatus kandeliicorticis]
MTRTRPDRAPAAPGDLAAAKADPAPHTWMDYPLSGAPPLPTVVFGVLLFGLGLTALVVPAARGDLGRHVGLLTGLFFLLGVPGLTLVRIGMQRFWWRRRHPGVDPLLTERYHPSDPDRAGWRVFRVLVLVIGVPVATFLGLVVVTLAVGSRDPGTSVAVRVGSTLLALAVTVVVVRALVADVQAIRRARARRRHRG